MNNDLRIKMSVSDFDLIPKYDDPEYLTYNFEEKLIQPLYCSVKSKTDIIRIFLQMTDGQKFFFTFSEIHKEIYNGGIAQFCWNQIELKDFAIKTFEILNDTLITSKYRVLLIDLENKSTKLKELKLKNDYAEFANYLNSNEFDDMFFKRVVYLQESMIKYIKDNKTQFIKD